jgi:hypothetical protein
VLEKTSTGPRLLDGAEGSEHPSGADFDEAVLRLVLGGLGDRGRDLKSDNAETRARLAAVRRQCTAAKEALSTTGEAAVTVALPGYTTTVRLSRPEFESLIRPALRDSITMMARVLRGAGQTASELAAIALVGGCTRMPIVADLLQREFEVPISLGSHPEYDVAVGAVLTGQPADGAGSAAAVTPVDAPPPVEEPAPVDETTEVGQTPVSVDPDQVDPAPVGPALAAAAVAAPVVAASGPVAAAPPPVVPPEPEGPSPEPEPPPPAVDESSAAPMEEATLISAAPVIWTPAVDAEDGQLTEALPGAESSPAGSEQMPDHLIFDYFTSVDTDTENTMPDHAAYLTQPAQPAVAGNPAPTSPGWGAPTSMEASNAYPPGQPPARPPQRPGPYPSGQNPQGQRPQGQRPPHPGGPGGYPTGGPPTQPYGAGPGGPGGYPPGPGGPGGSGSGPFGSRRRLILVIVGVVVLVGAAVGVGFAVSRSGESTASPSPGIVLPPQTSSPAASPSPTGSPSGSATASPTSGPTPTGTRSPGTVQTLPKSAPIPESVVIVPMRRPGDEDRALFLVDTEGQADQIDLPSPEGLNSGPMMQASRDTIIYLNDRVLRVMAADGSEDRKLFNRDPAGCDEVQHASWSLADPNVMVIGCRVSKNRVTLLVVGMDGRLIRRLDAGKDVAGDFAISPDGQTVLFWASDTPGSGGGAIYTLPLIGTGAPKALTDSADGVDADPAWSPDGTQIAFRRTIPDGTEDGNEDVYVMNADGSGIRPVAETKAQDFKPVWSPDGENLLIISNRKSAFGGPRKAVDLWLTRVSDGEVLTPLGLDARAITRPFWTLR